MDRIVPEAGADQVHDGHVSRVLIAGGGTAGWMAAAYLAKRFDRVPLHITVVESSSIGTVGVGEATVPGIRDFFRALDLDERDLLAATEGTIKLGIEFDGWRNEGTSFFHPFGLYGAPANNVAFHHYWLKMRAAGLAAPIADFSLCTRLAKSGRLLPTPTPPVADLLFFNWAVHFDAALFAAVLKSYALERGVVHHDCRIDRVVVAPGGGRIDGLELDDGRTLTADLFIDCTGFRSLLLGEALGTPFHDWSHLLPCDRAVAVQSARAGELDPYTRSTARSAGWQWRIPLRHRVGNGYVYCSRHLSDDEALADLRGRLEGEARSAPNLLRFKAGRRDVFWVGNCIGIGLAAGFLEPLESTSISLVQTGLERLVDLWPTANTAPALAREYNRIGALEWDRVRDFIVAHYILNGRTGELFWDDCRKIEPPEPLAHRMALWKARGRFVRAEWDSFFDPSWMSIYVGLGYEPDAYDPLADGMSTDELNLAFGRMETALSDKLKLAVPHAEILGKMR